MGACERAVNMPAQKPKDRRRPSLKRTPKGSDTPKTAAPQNTSTVHDPDPEADAIRAAKTADYPTFGSAADVLEFLAKSYIPTRAGKPGSWKPVFLKALEQSANVSIAARVAGIHRVTAYDAREVDADFAKAWDAAMEVGIDMVEASAFKSAVFGDREPIYHQGIRVGEVVKYSDTMRALLLKGRRGQVFREKVEHSGTVEHLTLEDLRKRAEEADA